MDNDELKKSLMKIGMDKFCIDSLIKSAENKKISISRAFIMSLLGLYMGTITLIGIYFFFISSMSKKEFIAFTCMYIPIILIIYFFTPSLKNFFWSLKVLFVLRGR
jgi:hypothetical protein